MRKRNLFNPKLSKVEKHEFEIQVKHNMKRAYFTALGFVAHMILLLIYLKKHLLEHIVIIKTLIEVRSFLPGITKF